MLLKNVGQAQTYQEENNGEGGASGNGELNIQDILNNPEVKAAMQAQLDSEVSGLKGKNTELLKKMKVASEQNKLYEGIDLEKVQTLQKQIDENEEMRLLSEGKTEEVVARRVENMQRDHESTLTALNGKITDLETFLKGKEEDLTKLVIDGQIREAYVNLDFEPSAMDDTIRNGREVFVMGDDGKAVPRDSSGNIIFGKDGKSPLTAAEWLDGVADTKKYLRRESKGSGAQGSGRPSGEVDTSKMSSTQRIAHGLRNGALGS